MAQIFPGIHSMHRMSIQTRWLFPLYWVIPMITVNWKPGRHTLWGTPVSTAGSRHSTIWGTCCSLPTWNLLKLFCPCTSEIWMVIWTEKCSLFPGTPPPSGYMFSNQMGQKRPAILLFWRLSPQGTSCSAHRSPLIWMGMVISKFYWVTTLTVPALPPAKTITDSSVPVSRYLSPPAASSSISGWGMSTVMNILN